MVHPSLWYAAEVPVLALSVLLLLSPPRRPLVLAFSVEEKALPCKTWDYFRWHKATRPVLVRGWFQTGELTQGQKDRLFPLLFFFKNAKLESDQIGRCYGSSEKFFTKIRNTRNEPGERLFTLNCMSVNLRNPLENEIAFQVLRPALCMPYSLIFLFHGRDQYFTVYRPIRALLIDHLHVAALLTR